MKKAQIWISAVLYTLIVVVAIVIVLSAIVPLINRMKDRAVFQKVKNELVNLDADIVEVASEGIGSQRTIPIEIQSGVLKAQGGRIFWEIQSEAKLLEPRTSLRLGNMFFSSNADVNASVSGSTVMLENSRVSVEFNSSATNISRIITKMSMGAVNLPNLPGGLEFRLDGAEFPSVTSTELVPGAGTNFGRVTFVAHTSNPLIDVEFTLEGNSDFLITNVDID
jgi:hypothetical protein